MEMILLLNIKSTTQKGDPWVQTDRSGLYINNIPNYINNIELL